MTLNYKQLIENSLSEEERNSFAAAFNLMGIVKSAPFQMLKAVGIAAAFYFVMIIFLFIFSASWPIIFLAIVVGFIATIALSITGSVKFISDLFLDNISSLLIGLLKPIDKLYCYYCQSSTVNLNRWEFTLKFLKESFIPTVMERMKSIPFKAKLTERLLKMVNHIEETTSNSNLLKKEVSLVGESTELTAKVKTENDPMFFKNMRSTIESAADNIKARYNNPFYKSLKISGGCWSIIWLLHLIVS